MLSTLANTYGAQSLYSAYASQSTTSIKASGSYLDITGGLGGSRYSSGVDSVDVSSMAREMLDRINNLDVFSCIFPDNNPAKGTKSLGQVAGDFMSYFTSFAGMMGGIVGDAGTVTMGLDGKGGMTIQGDDAAVTRASSAVNSTMTARFAVMAARAALMDAGQTVDGFSDDYASDPYAAIKNNIGALEDRLLGFRTQVGGGTAQYGFMRDAEIEYSATTASYGAAAVK
ncbi:MAG: hypothetical protein LUE17_14685 [Planctomycetaceae bacterium]|nr:hypothetical protein [Planctomycetaceae bacterium]